MLFVLLLPQPQKLQALYQGTTSVVPPLAENDQGFSPCLSLCGPTKRAAEKTGFLEGDGLQAVHQ
jgi:hypothetical protein